MPYQLLISCQFIDAISLLTHKAPLIMCSLQQFQKAFFKNNKYGMIFHENCLLADNSHEISYLIFFSKLMKYVAKFVVCCSCDYGFKGKYGFIVCIKNSVHVDFMKLSIPSFAVVLQMSQTMI